MGLYEAIENLQSRPEGTRRKVLMFLVVVSFLLLVSLWVFTAGKRITNDDSSSFGITPENQGETAAKKKEQESSLLEPLASLKEGFSVVVSDIKNAAEEMLSSTDEVLQKDEEEIEKAPEIYRLPLGE